MSNVYTIGRVPGYNTTIDPHAYYENSLLPKLTLVDFTPVFLKSEVNINNILNAVKKINLGELFDLSKGVSEFQKMMDSHMELFQGNVKYAGESIIRVIATTDSAINLSVTHDYGQNMAEKLIQMHTQNSSLSGIINELKRYIGAAARTTGELTTGNAIIDQLLNKHIELPAMWNDSTVQNVFQLNIKLTSPFGDEDSIYNYIINPLLTLYIMANPTSSDLSRANYGPPFVWQVTGHGIGKMVLAGIQTINVDRGGPDTVYNINHQPLTINVRMSIVPLSNQSVTSTKGVSDYENRWFENPKTIHDSLVPDDSISDVNQISKNGWY